MSVDRGKDSPKFWLRTQKTQLSDTLNKISSYRMPAVSRPEKEKTEKQSPSNSYIRMEQIDKATNLYSYSAFLHEVEKYAPPGTARNVAAMDLFIRSLRPDIKVTCQFNHLLKSGSIELVRREESVKMHDCMCPEMESIQGRSIILGKRIHFEVSFQKQCLVLTNVSGLQMGLDVMGNYLQSSVTKLTFRAFEGAEYLQVVYADNPLSRLRSELKSELSFISAAQLGG